MITCLLRPNDNKMDLHRNDRCIGYVVQREGADEPEIILFGDMDSMVYTSFNDFKIIMDNWNQMQEIRKSK